MAGLVVRLAALDKEAATALVLVDRFISYISVIIVGALISPSGRSSPTPRRERG